MEVGEWGSGAGEVGVRQASSNSRRAALTWKEGGLLSSTLPWQSFHGNVSLEDISGLRGFLNAGCGGGQEPAALTCSLEGDRLVCGAVSALQPTCGPEGGAPGMLPSGESGCSRKCALYLSLGEAKILQPSTRLCLFLLEDGCM